MDKKLTDSEIVKALECCAINRNCKGCYLDTHEVNDMCPRVLMQNTLDLINRLQAEVERLKNIGDNKTKELLRHNIFIEELHEKIKTAKAEAYKECIEKVKEKSSTCVATNNGIVVAGSRTYTISEVALYEIEKETENHNAK